MHEQRAVTPYAEALLDEVERLRVENAALRAVVAQQAALIEQLLRRVQELEARRAKDIAVPARYGRCVWPSGI